MNSLGKQTLAGLRILLVLTVLTGILYPLGVWVVSRIPGLQANAEGSMVTVNGQTFPEAYSSVQLIESIPVANLFRNTHHWAAHLMVAAVLLHLLRVFFTGTYRKPREINWVVGVVLLGLTLVAGFVGYRTWRSREVMLGT